MYYSLVLEFLKVFDIIFFKKMLEKRSKNLSNSTKSSNKKKKALTKNEKRTKTSLIWEYFEEAKTRSEDGEEITIIVCQVKKEDNTTCGVSYVYTSGSTGNAINHLRNIHEIIDKNGKNQVRD